MPLDAERHVGAEQPRVVGQQAVDADPAILGETAVGLPGPAPAGPGVRFQDDVDDDALALHAQIRRGAADQLDPLDAVGANAPQLAEHVVGLGRDARAVDQDLRAAGAEAALAQLPGFGVEDRRHAGNAAQQILRRGHGVARKKCLIVDGDR